MGGKESTLLISETNLFLDKISEPKTLKEAEQNAKKLQKMKEEMLNAGFGAPFQARLIATSKEFGDEEYQDDAKKQLAMFREFANMKRYTLNRTRVALAAHNILLNMMRRGKIYEVAHTLPYNGSYLSMLVSLGEPAVRAYNKILKLSESRTVSQPEYNITIKHNGETITFDVHSDKNLEEKIKKSYKGEVEILEIKRIPPQPPLVRKQSVRVAVAAAYAILAAQRHYPPKQTIGDSPKHSEYADLIGKVGFSDDTRLDLLEGHEDLKDRLYSKGLLSEERGMLRLAPEVVEAISNKKSHYTKKVIAEAEKQFSFDIFHFVISEPKRVRSSYPLFTGISDTIDTERMDFLSCIGIEKPVEILNEKLKLESFNIALPSKTMGATLLYLRGKPLEWCSQTFEVPEEEIKKASPMLSPYLRKGISGQAKRFLELAKE